MESHSNSQYLGLTGKKVLDIGANDGFFSLAALMAGAKEVTSIDKDWATWPHNIKYVSHVWNVNPQIITADFRHYDFPIHYYDVIFFFGVLYHLEDVFTCMKKLNGILVQGGMIYLETQMSQIQHDLPIFECASDVYPTIARQGKESLNAVGISNYLFPNEAAIYNLADSYNFQCEIATVNSDYTQSCPTRQIFKLVKQGN